MATVVVTSVVMKARSSEVNRRNIVTRQRMDIIAPRDVANICFVCVC